MATLSQIQTPFWRCRSSQLTQRTGPKGSMPELLSMQVLMWAELRSNSQGCVKLAAGALDRHPEASSPHVQQETSVSASLDGGQQLGMLAMQRALQLALQKAEQSGVALVGVHNTSSSEGALGYAALPCTRSSRNGCLKFNGPARPPRIR